MSVRAHLELLDRALRFCANALLAVMFLDILMQVLFRYVLRNPLVWTEELARFLLAWMVYLGASSAVFNWENLRVTYFIEKLPKKAFSVVEVVTKVLSLVLLVYVFVAALRVIPNVGVRETAPALGIKMIIPELAIIVGLAFMIVQLIGIFVGMLISPVAGRSDGQGG